MNELERSLRRDEINQAVLRHRTACERLVMTRVANERRGASAAATDLINQAGEARAASERELMRLMDRVLAAVPEEFAPRED